MAIASSGDYFAVGYNDNYLHLISLKTKETITYIYGDDS